MNIYDYFHSPDIAAHCRKIGHEFSPLDMAVIVCRSDKPILEKHEGYWRIIAEQPDMPIHKSMHWEVHDSLHEYLRVLIRYEADALETLLAAEAGSVFCPAVRLDSKSHVYNEGFDGVFSTFEKAVAQLHVSWDWDEDSVECGIIRKVKIDEPKTTSGELRVNRKGDILRYIIYNNNGKAASQSSLEDIFIHIPMPFEMGDLVCGWHDKPCVIFDLPHWWREYDAFVAGTRGDGSDMIGYGYYVEEGGLLYRDHIFNTDELRYYTDELTGQEQFLKYLGKYIKGKDTDLSWLISVFMKYHAEAQSENWNALFGHWFRNLADE